MTMTSKSIIDSQLPITNQTRTTKRSEREEPNPLKNTGLEGAALLADAEALEDVAEEIV